MLNDGLGRHEATFIIPAMYVLNTVLNIVGGELLYQVADADRALLTAASLT